MKLSQRLNAVAHMVPQHCRLADVGADRGELSYVLLEQGLAEHIILSDLSPHSLNRAKALFAASPFEGQTEFRVGSGFTVLRPKEADCAVLAGMGGETIVTIFTEAPEITASFHTIIVQAMGNSHRVRRYFMDHHFAITAEAMVEEDGHFYTIIKGEPGEMRLTEQELYAGKFLIEEKNPALKTFLAKERLGCLSIAAALKAKDRGKQRQEELLTRAAFYETIEEAMK